ncbi:hypothetical protein PAMC26577_04695 [Caballeronia sordidicola]|uniref:Uncharacterized protein n=1 Tax=Caballeronia sordidicola TaxID=196367 RepID=A0A242N4W9_CABSO|nr:hypothetical protein PAMC26577_04695 [Caballeronia sordidicola]
MELVSDACHDWESCAKSLCVVNESGFLEASGFSSAPLA